MADQHRFDCVGAYGNQDVKTPNVDALANEGVKFTNSFCPYPICTPSRYSLLSGLYVHQHMGFGNSSTIPTGTPTFPKVMRAAGYKTKAVGKMHLTPVYYDVGFDEMLLAEQGHGMYVDDYNRYLREKGLCDESEITKMTEGAPRTMGGLDLSGDRQARDFVYSEHGLKNQRMVRTRTRKLILCKEDHLSKYFNLVDDPYEMNNLYGHESYQKEIADLKEKFYRWRVFDVNGLAHADREAPITKGKNSMRENDPEVGEAKRYFDEKQKTFFGNIPPEDRIASDELPCGKSLFENNVKSSKSC